VLIWLVFRRELRGNGLLKVHDAALGTILAYGVKGRMLFIADESSFFKVPHAIANFNALNP
jgi:hypothetical protein